MRRILFLAATLFLFSAHAQVTDDFTDGDFTADPVWSGTSSFAIDDAFEIVETDNQLRSQDVNAGSGTRLSYLSTSAALDLTSATAEWSFRLRLNFSQPGAAGTNSNNTSRVYLMSDVADLNGDVDGYYVELRYPASDVNEVRLYRQDASTTTELSLSGTVQELTSQAFADVTVSRSELGVWEVEVNSTSQGTVTDNNYSSCSYFGVQVRFTANSRDNGFYFDDFATTVTPLVDTTPPTIQSATAISDTEVDVQFSEDLNPALAEGTSNYAIDGMVTVTGATLDTDNSLVHLTTDALTNGETYTLTVNNIQDTNGNTIVANSEEIFEYLVFEEAEAFDVVINEFMAAPGSGSGVPNAEYVELYNRSTKFINLEDWTISDATGSSSAFSATTLRPDEYLILTSIGNGTLFNAYGDVLEVSGFPALNNGGDDITITNSLATDIHSITYASSTSEISTELINPNGPDYSENNYGLSTDPDGGTPGAQNSIFDDTPDTTPPAIVSISVISQTALDVSFDEPLEETSAETIGNYAIDGGIAVTAAMLDNSDDQLVHLTIDPLVSGEERTLTINDVEDLSGNPTVNASGQFEYLEVEEALAGDVIINEFLSNPVNNNDDFIELLNVSDKFIDMAGWNVSDGSDTSEDLPSFILRPGAYLIIYDEDATIDYSAFGDALTIASLTLNNSDDQVEITSGTDVQIDFLDYGEEQDDGVSLELINPTDPCRLLKNYLPSTDPSGSTPGAQNSVFDDEFFDTTAPAITTITVVSNTALDVAFDEELEETSAETNGNYSIDGGISVVSATLDATDNQLVHLVVDPLVSEEVRTLTVNGVEDLCGNQTADETIQFEYLETVEAVVGDVIINEFLSNPVNDLNDFVELYNVSDKLIDMAGWNVSDGSDTSEDLPSFILRPGAYLIIYDEDATIDYSAFGDALTIASLTLNNSDDQVEITSGTDVQIDFLAYGEEQDDGVSLELINPTDPCRLLKNYLPSTDPSGSTPGAQNSVFDDEFFDTTAPAITTITVVSNTALDVAFDEELEETSAETIGNYSIDGSISVVSATLDATDNQLVHLVVDPLVSEEVRTLTINGVEDLCGNQTADETIQFEYIETQEAVAGDVIINEFLSNPVDNNDDFIELYNVSDKFIDMAGWNIKDELSTSEDLPSFILLPGAYLIIYDEDATIDYSAFGDALTIASLTLNNSDDQIEITSGTDVQIDFLAYQEEQEDGISLELTNPNDPCRSLGSYAASIDPSGSTPGAQNSVFDDTPDTNPPTIQSYNFDTNLTINFSEAMDPASLTSGTYSVSGGLTINEVLTTGLFPTSVAISFNESIELGVTYELTVANVTDCPGNSIVETTITFGQGRSPGFNELIITELMFDPDPQVDLPSREFIEVYNATSDIISTAGINLTDASSTVELPTRSLNPGAYYALTTTSGASEFTSNVIGVPSFPSLNNGGEQLTLSLGDNPIFSLTYDPDWHEEEKADGGYSLEMVDVTNPCLEDGSNWTSSQDSRGGTPGAANSVSEIIPDSFGPEILVATAVLSDSIRVDFTEKIDPSSTDFATAALSPSIAVNEISFDFLNPATLIITLNEDLQESVPYTLSITGVVDCSGNEIQNGEVAFALPVQTEADEIKLSEVLFNPRSNGVDFVEVYNTSEKYISLKDWKLATLDDEGEVDDVDMITANELVIAPGQYLVFTTDADILLSNYPKGQSLNFVEMPALPSYPNDEGTVLLIDQSDEIKESFEYTEDYHYNLLESVDGVSLERVSFVEATNSGDNWRSAASTEGFATPGYTNSQSFVNTTPIGRVTASPEVFIPGNSGSGRDFTTINYSFDQPGQFANVNIYDQTGRLVKNLAQGVLLSTSGFLRWDGDTNGGNVARMGYYLIVFEIYDSSGNSETIKETVVVGRDF